MSGFRLKGSARRTTTLSTSGVIRGGVHDCWRYCFKRFATDARGNLRIELIAGEPGWPFPREISLTRTGFNSLEPIKGERAPKVDAAPLIAQALSAHADWTPARAARTARVHARYVAAVVPAEHQLAPVGIPAGAQ